MCHDFFGYGGVGGLTEIRTDHRESRRPRIGTPDSTLAARKRFPARGCLPGPSSRRGWNGPFEFAGGGS